MELALPDYRTLSRLTVRLVALAVLADRAAGRSFPVRWLVLTLLRHAEAAVHAFLIEVTGIAWPGFEEPAETGASRRDATLLALRLRAHAALVRGLRLLACLLECCRIARPRPREPRSGPAGNPSGGCPPRAADTS